MWRRRNKSHRDPLTEARINLALDIIEERHSGLSDRKAGLSNRTFFAISEVVHKVDPRRLCNRQEILDQIGDLDRNYWEFNFHSAPTKDEIKDWSIYTALHLANKLLSSDPPVMLDEKVRTVICELAMCESKERTEPFSLVNYGRTCELIENPSSQPQLYS
jgi:hypothetical protein